MPRVIYFELGVKEPEKSLEFYRKVFGWEINRMGKMDYWLASTGERQEPGINGAFIKQTADSQPIVYTIAVGEIDSPRDALIGDAESPGALQHAAAMLKSGMFYGNPRSQLCGAKFCPAHATCVFRK